MPAQKAMATKPSNPSNPWTNYTTAASLGYTDPDEERMKADLERRRTQGVAGEWEVVEQPTSTKDGADVTPKKRDAEGPPDPEDVRGFKLRKKAAPSVTDNWDADSIPIKLKPKKIEEVPEPAGEVKNEDQSTDITPVKWSSRGWKRPEDELDGTSSPLTPTDEEAATKDITVSEPDATISGTEVGEKSEILPVKVATLAETSSETGAVFRKRKFVGNRGKR